MKPLVSIIIPIHNTPIEYFDACYSSITNQTYTKTEILLINDGSSEDNSHKYRKYKCDKYIYQQNRGVSAARNRGLDAANGDYILFVDSDDYIDYDYIEKMIIMAAREKTDIVMGKMRLFGPAMKAERDTKYDLRGEDFRIELLKHAESYVAPGKLISRKIIGDIRFDESMLFSEDVLFFSKICTGKISCADCIYYYRRSNNSATFKFNNITARKYIEDSAKFIDSMNSERINSDEVELAKIKRLINALSRMVYGVRGLKYADFKSFIVESTDTLKIGTVQNRKALRDEGIKVKLFSARQYLLIYLFLKINRFLKYENKN